MTDELKKFQPKITDVENVEGELRFVLNLEMTNMDLINRYGNAIRRILLTDIPTVGFNLNLQMEKGTI